MEWRFVYGTRVIVWVLICAWCIWLGVCVLPRLYKMGMYVHVHVHVHVHVVHLTDVGPPQHD